MKSTFVFSLVLLVIGLFCDSASALQCYSCTTINGPNPGCTTNLDQSYLGPCNVACATATGTLTRPGESSSNFVQRGCLDILLNTKSGKCSCTDSNIGKLDLDYTACKTDGCNDASGSTTGFNHSSIQLGKKPKATDTTCYICTSVSGTDYDAGCEGPDLDDKYLDTCKFGCTNAIGTYTFANGGESHKVVRRGCQPDTRIENGNCNCKDPALITIDFNYETCFTDKCNGSPSVAVFSSKLAILSLLLCLMLR